MATNAINVKGTHDIFGQESSAFNYIEQLSKSICELFAYKEFRPPVLEHEETFIRSVGEGSDVVRKEMYTFLDKSDRAITLRPEFTAGMIRLIVQNKLLPVSELPLKAYYTGPVFRYERPQLGRYRQFNQFGVESIGNDNPLNDVEVITLAYTILQSLGLKGVSLKINTLGDEESRNNYKNALKDFFESRIDKMCPDCKSRYELNPLRILDCKVPEDQEIVKDAPKMGNFLSSSSKERFDYILNKLDESGIPYEVDESLVRGLDYYSQTVFEFHYVSNEGNNYGAIGAGGHYSNLVNEFNGGNYPGIGFSFGVERLYSVLKDDNLLPEEINDSIQFYFMPLGDKEREYGLDIANYIRMQGYSCDICFDNIKMGSMFKRAERKNACYAVIIGENEIKNESIIIKNMTSGEQKEVKNADLDNELSKMFESCECHCHDGEECDDEHCCCHHKEEK